MAAVKALQQWCRLRCQGYRDVSITNMTTSFRDGLAFCALIHTHRPELINFDSLRKEDVFENNKLAFKVAEEQLGIPALLDAEDMVALKVPDRLSILTYVSQYYNYFHGRSPIGGMGGIKRPAEEPTEEVSGKKNLPVNSKVYYSPNPGRENSPPASSYSERPAPSPKQARSAGQDVLVEKSNQTGTLSNKCAACHKHVHLVQRHLVDRKLYHRSCAKSLMPTSTAALFQDLPATTTTTTTTTTPLSKVTPAPHSQPPSHHSARLGPSWLAERGSGSSSAVSPPRPASSLSPAAAKHTSTMTVTVHNIAPRTPSEAATRPSPAPAPTPVPAPRTSTTAAKTLQSKLKFFESDHSANEKTAPTAAASSGDAGRGANKQPASAALRTEPATSPSARETEGNKCPAAGGRSKVADNSKTKGAAAFISSKLAARSENISSRPELKKPDVTPSPADSSHKGGRGRVRLKVDQSLLADLQNPDTPSPAARTGAREPSPVPGPGPGPGPAPAPAKPFTARHSTPAPESESPAGWRSKLKPTPREARPAAPSPSSHPPDRQISSPSPPGPSIFLTPAPKGLLNGQEEKKENGTKPESKLSKPKADYISKEEILRQLQDIEDDLNKWEKRGVELEVKLRTCEEEGEDECLMDELMVEWFNLIRNKQVAMRRESELVYIGRSQELEEQQPSVEQELRRLMEIPEHLKTARQKKREEELMAKLMEIVSDRNAIVEGLDEDRIREGEEDEQLNAMMKNFNIKKEKPKKKSPVSKLFRWGSKKEE